MMLDRLGRYTLHERRYAEPRAISRFEGDSRADDAGFQVVDNVESVSPEPARRESAAVPIRESRPESAAGAGDALDLESGVSSFVETEISAPRTPVLDVERPASPPQPAAKDTVETLLRREFLETRAEFVTVPETAPQQPEQVLEPGSTTKTADVDAGLLSREFEAVEARISRLEAKPVTSGPDQPPTNPSITIAPSRPAMQTPGPPTLQEHHVEVLIDSIVVAISPGEPAARTSPKRDPAEGLARFQQSRRR